MAKVDQKLFQQAKKYLVGGVNSPVRSFKAVGGEPIFIKKGRGSKIYSEDGHELIDYCQSYGALILGHARPEIVKSVNSIAREGTVFGTPTRSEIELAKVITKAIPSMEKIRLTNSGTESVMGAVRLARAFTGKNKIIKFKICYHGTADYLLDCPGVPEDFKKNTLVAPYNDLNAVQGLVNKYKKDIAGIIVEPVAGNTGLVLPEEGFLEGLRKLATKNNIVLIFDEVITGFRLNFGGAQKLFKIKPDLTCLGKIIGGGLPIGAFGGRKEIMQLLAPEGNVYQAGTFSGNPLTVNAGLTALRILAKENPYPKLAELTQDLCRDVSLRFQENGIKAKVNFIGSIFNISMDKELFKKFYHRLLREGIYLAPSQFEVNFVSAAHTLKDIEKTKKIIEKVCSF